MAKLCHHHEHVVKDTNRNCYQFIDIAILMVITTLGINMMNNLINKLPDINRLISKLYAILICFYFDFFPKGKCLKKQGLMFLLSMVL